MSRAAGAPRARVGPLRPDPGLRTLERAVRRAGFRHVAGTDEAGRGACAGPLVVAACVLDDGRRGRVPGLADSKLLTAAQREEVEADVRDRAVALSVVVVDAAEVDARGVHVVDLEGMRRAVAALDPSPDYVLSDGFPLAGTPGRSLAVVRGDRVAACVAAAGVLAKTARDRLLVELDARWPGYGFARHKGYVVDAHTEALEALGPCPEHRASWVPVRRAVARRAALRGWSAATGTTTAEVA